MDVIKMDDIALSGGEADPEKGKTPNDHEDGIFAEEDASDDMPEGGLNRTKTLDAEFKMITDDEIEVDPDLLKKLGVMLGGIVFFLLYVMVAVVALSNTEDWELSDAFWFTIVTLTTVGYGDISPQGNAGRIFMAFYILIGLSTVAGTFLLLIEMFDQGKEREQQAMIEKATHQDDDEIGSSAAIAKRAKVKEMLRHVSDEGFLDECIEFIKKSKPPAEDDGNVPEDPDTGRSDDDNTDPGPAKDDDASVQEALQEATDGEPQKRWYQYRWHDMSETSQNFCLVLLVFIVGLIFFTQHPEESLSLADAFYFSAVTFSTVGYGDVSPVSTDGKIFAIFWMIAGVSMMGKVLGAVNDYYNKLHKEKFMKMLTRKRSEDDLYSINPALRKLDEEDVENIVKCFMMLFTLINASFLNDALFATFNAVIPPEASIWAGWLYCVLVGSIGILLLINLPSYSVYYNYLFNRAYDEATYNMKLNEHGSTHEDEERPPIASKKLMAKLEHLAVESKIGDMATQSTTFAMAIALNRTLETTFKAVAEGDNSSVDDIETAETSLAELCVTWGFALFIFVVAYGALACCVESVEILNRWPLVHIPRNESFRDDMRNMQAGFQVTAMALLSSWAIDAAFQDTFNYVFEDLEGANAGLKVFWAVCLTLGGVVFSLWISHRYPPQEELSEENEEAFDKRNLILQSTSFVVALSWVQAFTFMFLLLGESIAAASLFVYSVLMGALAMYSVSHMEKFVAVVAWVRTKINKKDFVFPESVLKTDEFVFNDWFVQAFAMITAISFSESVKNALKALYDPGESAGGTIMSFWVALLVTTLVTVGCMGMLAYVEHKKKLNIKYFAVKNSINHKVAPKHENDEKPTDVGPSESDEAPQAGGVLA